MEKQFSRAQKKAQKGVEALPLVREVDSEFQQSAEAQESQVPPQASQDSLPCAQGNFQDSSQGVSDPVRPGPSASFTPTAAGLRPQDGLGWPSQIDFQSLFTDALAKAIASGLQQGSRGSGLQAGWAPAAPPPIPASAAHCHTEEVSSDESGAGDAEQQDPEFSEDEEVVPDRPAFSTLFRLEVFKTLLRKAKIATNMGRIVNPVYQGSGSSQPHGELFAVPAPDQDFIPCPELFKDVIKKQWEAPGVLSAPSGHDKRLYCADPVLEGLLNLPTVDPPVVSLSSSTVLSSDAVEVLKSDERRAEVTLMCYYSLCFCGSVIYQ